jgi:hypothetical protein
MAIANLIRLESGLAIHPRSEHVCPKRGDCYACKRNFQGQENRDLVCSPLVANAGKIVPAMATYCWDIHPALSGSSMAVVVILDERNPLDNVNWTRQAIFDDLHYDKPFLVTYLCTASFAVYLIPYLLGRMLGRRRPDGEKDHE